MQKPDPAKTDRSLALARNPKIVRTIRRPEAARSFSASWQHPTKTVRPFTQGDCQGSVKRNPAGCPLPPLRPAPADDGLSLLSAATEMKSANSAYRSA